MRSWHLDPADGYEPLIGRFVTMLADTRRRLHRDLEDLDAPELDRIPEWGLNSIGTLLYHVAAIELDWTFADLLERGEDGFPEETAEWFPVDVRDEGGRLTPVVEPLQRHLDRLEWARGHLLAALGGFTDADLDETVNPGEEETGRAFILHHLMQHEAEHRGQIGEIKVALRG